MEVKRTKAVQASVESRIGEGVCLYPGCDRSIDEPGGNRGRCLKHAGELSRERMNRTRLDRLAIEERAMKAGTLLGPDEIRKLRKRKSV